MFRTLSLCSLALGLLAFVSASALADDQAKDKANADTHEGTVVSVKNDQITMKGKGTNAKEMTHTLAPNARVMCDGKECKLLDLKPGQKIRVTTKAGDKTTVTKVEALDKNQNFEKPIK